MPYSHIQWPAGLDETIFLANYWQQKPLLIRQALPNFETPLPADELAGLSLEPDTTPRLITQDQDGAYHLEHGPFDAERFNTLTDNNWSLLVTDVEKHIPELLPYLQPFFFLPRWRIDDLMVSYAPLGASVGAHIDEYDVFLLQASGSRQWSIDAPAADHYELLPDAELKLLANFKPSDSWTLAPGDLLYLPPGVPHHGVASEDPCTTWSIGFRAPTTADIVMRMAELLCENLPHQRYTDGPMKPADSGEISADALARFADIWRQAVDIDAKQLTTLTGRLLSESPTISAAISDDSEEIHPLDDSDEYWQTAAFSRLAWCQDAELAPQRARLFVDGDSYSCNLTLAKELCQPGQMLRLGDAHRKPDDLNLLRQLIQNGSLVLVEED